MALGSAEHGNRRRSRAEPVPPLNPHDAGFLRELAPELGGFVDRGPHRHITAALSLPTLHQPSIPSQLGALPAPYTHGASQPFTLQPPAAVDLGEANAADDWTAPDDVEAALQLLVAQFPVAARAAGCGPLMLKNQLYAVVEHRTTVDRRLDSLRESGVLRMFKLSSGTADDYAYLFEADYADLVRAQRENLQASGSTPEHLIVLDWFLARVAPHAREASISHIQLVKLLSEPPARQSLAAVAGNGFSDYGSSSGVLAGTDSGAGSAVRGGSQSGVNGRAHKRPRVRNPAAGSQSSPEDIAPRRGSFDLISGVDPARKSPSRSDGALLLGNAIRRGKDLGFNQQLPGNRRTSSDSDRASRAVHGRPQGSTAGVRGGGDRMELPVAVSDAHISLLLNGGIIARHPNEVSSYLFSVPIAGALVKSIAKGRVELLGLVTRRRYSEMREKDLEGFSLQRSLMDMRFHVRDLIGMGALQRVQTTSGTILRAPKRK